MSHPWRGGRGTGGGSARPRSPLGVRSRTPSGDDGGGGLAQEDTVVIHSPAAVSADQELAGDGPPYALLRVGTDAEDVEQQAAGAEEEQEEGQLSAWGGSDHDHQQQQREQPSQGSTLAADAGVPMRDTESPGSARVDDDTVTQSGEVGGAASRPARRLLPCVRH